MANAETHLTYTDIVRCHVQHRKPTRARRWIPAWTKNEKMFRAVIMARGWNYAMQGRHKSLPPDKTFQELKRLCDKRFEQDWAKRWYVKSKKAARILEAHTTSVRQHGGYLPFMATLLYLSLRLGFESSQVAMELNLPTAVMVRQAVYRANEVATRLGFPGYLIPHRSRGRIKHGRISPKGLQTRHRRVKVRTFLLRLERTGPDGQFKGEILSPNGVSPRTGKPAWRRP